MNLAIFASGHGSNFRAILNAIKKKTLKETEVGFFFSDRSESGACAIAKEHKIPCRILSVGERRNKATFEAELSQTLLAHKIDLVVLAGYMCIVGKTLLKNWEGKIINLHPSILPHFPGKNAIANSFAARSEFAGVTIHFIDAGMDTGKIIRQIKVPIGDFSLKEFEQKIRRTEHRLLPEVIEQIRDLNFSDKKKGKHLC